MKRGKDSFYAKYIKRGLDVLCALLAMIILSPLFLTLTVLGAIKMKGNPFFVQARPGKKDKNGQEKIFKLIKFRTMTNERDAEGELLPDDKRLNGYGRFLRKTSMDELPQLLDVITGRMSFIGPRPLLVQYIPRYTAHQRRRHEATPGITGWAQINGRNAISWEAKFEMDVWYVDNLSPRIDLKIFFGTIKKILRREGINSATSETMEEFLG